MVEADVFGDGHDQLTSMLLFRREEETSWQEVPMAPIGNDRWRASFEVTVPGRYRYTIDAWVDHYRTWRHDLRRRVDAGQDVDIFRFASDVDADQRAEIARMQRLLKPLKETP